MRGRCLGGYRRFAAATELEGGSKAERGLRVESQVEWRRSWPANGLKGHRSRTTAYDKQRLVRTENLSLIYITLMKKRATQRMYNGYS